MGRRRKQYGSKRRTENRREEAKNFQHNIGIKNGRRESVSDSLSDSSMHTRNVNSRRIFRNEKLTCQFLKDYAGLSFFDDIRPEDIEDVTEKYQAYLGIEFESDTVKKIWIRTGEEKQEIYVIPLIEHKSDVDYNVQMQLLRYMSVIWYDHGKRQNKAAGRCVTKLKSFRYPLIIPVVYYEGTGSWTADDHLWKRVELGSAMRTYIPDFTYRVIRVQDYSSEEIKKHTNEMSLVMMLNRIQSPEDYTDFIKSSKAYMTEVLRDTPQELLEILQDVFWALLMKMNVPQDEAKELMKHMGVKDMGYLFENAEKMDIQAERRNTLREKQRADAAEKRAASAEERAAIAEESAASAKTLVRFIFRNFKNQCKEEHLTEEETKIRFREFYQIDETIPDEYFKEA